MGAIGALGFAPFNLFPAFILAFAWLFFCASLTSVTSLKLDPFSANVTLDPFSASRSSETYASAIFALEAASVSQLQSAYNATGSKTRVLQALLSMHICCLYWLVYPLTIELHKHWMLIPFAIVVVPAYFSIQLAAAVWIAGKISSDIYERVLIFPALCSMAMYLYGHFSLGFPWVLPAYIWNCHEIFLQTLSIWGVYGLSFVTMLISCLLGASFVFLRRNDRKNAIISASISAFLLIFIVLFGIVKLNLHKAQFTSYRMRMVQCNLTQAEKSNDGLREQNLWKHLQYSVSEDRLDFILWPEASFPYLYNEKRADFQEAFQAVLKPGVHLLFGAVRKDLETAKYYNSVVAVNHLGQKVGCYDKIHLVPFGEYVPFRSLIPLPFQGIASDIGDFDVGELPCILEINGLKMAMAICYEAAFPVLAAPALMLSLPSEPYASTIFNAETTSAIENARGATTPTLQAHYAYHEEGSDARAARTATTVTLVVNVTNDAWFGPTSEPYQHLQIVRARSVELGVPLVRCTNYGISAVFDPCGREICRIPMNSAGFVDFYIPERLPGETPYERYGDLLFWLMIFVIAVIIVIKKSRSKETL